MPTLGERFKQLRIEQGLTQTEIVEKFNLKYHHSFGKSAISQYENNKRLPEIETLQEWADFFDVSMDYILGKSNKRSDTQNVDPDIRRIERAHSRMSDEEKEKMMAILNAAFNNFFDEDD